MKYHENNPRGRFARACRDILADLKLVEERIRGDIELIEEDLRILEGDKDIPLDTLQHYTLYARDTTHRLYRRAYIVALQSRNAVHLGPGAAALSAWNEWKRTAQKLCFWRRRK